MQADVCEPSSSQARHAEQRMATPELLILLEITPDDVAEGDTTLQGIEVKDVTLNGQMRETCPYCEATHLQLVLRQRHVKRAHLFCPDCTRCFDARFADGSPALSLID